MPLGVERDDGLVHDGLGAAVAARRELVRVARRAVRPSGLEHGQCNVLKSDNLI